MKEVRVHLELAVPVWHSGLNTKLTADNERVQRIAVKIILEDDSIRYYRACTMLGLKPLSIRRVELCERQTQGLIPTGERWESGNPK